MKRFFHIGSFTYLLWPARCSHAQAVPTASGSGVAEIGACWSFANAETAYTYKIYSFGGGIDIQATHNINVHAVDFEYQQWPGYQANGLTPQVWSFGAAYAFR